MAAINFNGLASGLDTGSIINQLVSLERQPISRLQQQRADVNKKISALGDLSSKLKTLKTRADELNKAEGTRAFTATSSDESVAKVSVTSGATQGSYALRVGQLARAETSRSSAFASDTAGIAGAGDLTITAGANSPVTVSYAASDSLSDIAARINRSGAQVNAAVVFDGSSHRLNISAKDTGAANGLSFAESGAGLGFTDPSAEVISARDAEFTINGTTLRRASNTVGDALAGVTLNLRAETATGAPDTQIVVSQDRDGVTKKLQGVVDAFNDVANANNLQLSFTGQTRSDRLSGDSTLQGLQRRLGSVIASPYASGSSTASIGSIGIKLNSDGTLSLDSAKLNAALDKDPKAVEQLISGDGTSSLAAALSSLADDYSKASTGILASKSKAFQGRTGEIDKQIDRLDANATSLESRLRQQFSALEKTISGLQSQSGFLNSIQIF